MRCEIAIYDLELSEVGICDASMCAVCAYVCVLMLCAQYLIDVAELKLMWTTSICWLMAFIVCSRVTVAISRGQ